jgi:hypothetical protein
MYLRLFDLIDVDGDGVAPLADIFDTLDLKRAEARQVKRVRALGANSDGKVTRAEVVAGVWAEIGYQTRRRLNTDADGDGELTSLEYALAVPDPNGKAELLVVLIDRFSARIRGVFLASTLSLNRRIER